MATDDHQHLRLVLHVARRYYLDGVDQAQIATEINFSRPTVSRLLAEAKRRGMVKMTVSHPLERVLRTESEISRAFGLRGARVADAAASSDTLTAIGSCAADFVSQHTPRDAVIALSNGRAVSAVVQAFGHMHRPTTVIVQMIGAIAQDNPLLDSSDICQRLAEKFGSTYRIMPAPLVVSSARLANALRREPSVQTAMVLGARADIAITGVGATNSRGSGPIFGGLLSKAEIAALAKAGAVGHICGHHIDINGHHIVSDLCDRTMSIPLKSLAAIQTVVCVAAGAEKVSPLLAALRGGYVDVLVTDLPTAQALLAAHRAK